MPIGPTRTKAQKQKVMHTEMHKFKEGDLHSGSKTGPVVKNRKQAIAIAMSESGQKKKSAPAMGQGESKGDVDRSAHFQGNPGFPHVKEEPLFKSSKHGYQEAHYQTSAFSKSPHLVGGGALSGAHCIGSHVKSGNLRLSGHKGAHQIGKRR